MFTYDFHQNKNIIEISARDNEKGVQRSYYFDVNTGILSNSRKQNLNRWPQDFVTAITQMPRSRLNAVAAMQIMCKYPRYIDNSNHNYNSITPEIIRNELSIIFQIGDKLQSIGYIYNSNANGINVEILECVNKNFKLFVKWYKDNPTLGMEDFFKEYGKQMWYEKFPEIEQYHCSARVRDYFYNYWRNVYTEEEIRFAIRAFGRGLEDYHEGNFIQCIDHLTNYFTYCKGLGKTSYPEKCDFFREYINTKREYDMQKKAISAKKIAEAYAPHLKALNYENDKFIIVIPKDSEDFKKEADAQQNCVYSMYLDLVQEKRTNVVFVRRKDSPEQSYITCEVTNSGKIFQYLAKYNNGVVEMDARLFKSEYQRWLRENWS